MCNICVHECSNFSLLLSLCFYKWIWPVVMSKSLCCLGVMLIFDVFQVFITIHVLFSFSYFFGRIFEKITGSIQIMLNSHFAYAEQKWGKNTKLLNNLIITFGANSCRQHINSDHLFCLKKWIDRKNLLDYCLIDNKLVIRCWASATPF